MKTVPQFNKSQNGSALLAVLIFSLLMTSLLAALMPMTISQLKMAQRESMNTLALYLAEAGADEAIWYLNNKIDINDWTNEGWNLTADGDYLTKTILLEDEIHQLESHYQGSIRIITEVPAGQNRVNIYVEGSLRSSSLNIPDVTRYLSLSARTNNPFMGLIAKDSLTFNGRPFFDSFNSDNFPYFYTFGVNSGNRVTVGSISKGVGSVSIGNATVLGNIVSGDSDPLSSGAVNMGASSNVSGSVIGDFDQDFPDVTAPDTSGWATSF